MGSENSNVLLAKACAQEGHGPLGLLRPLALEALSRANEQGRELSCREIWDALARGTGLAEMPLSALKLCCRSLALDGKATVSPTGEACSLSSGGTMPTWQSHDARDSRQSLEALIDAMAARADTDQDKQTANRYKVRKDLADFLAGNAARIFLRGQGWPGDEQWQGTPGAAGFVSEILRDAASPLRGQLTDLIEAMVVYLAVYGYCLDDFASIKPRLEGTELVPDEWTLLRLLGLAGEKEKEAAASLITSAKRYGCYFCAFEGTVQAAKAILTRESPAGLLEMDFYLRRIDPAGKSLASQASGIKDLMEQAGIGCRPEPPPEPKTAISGLSDLFGPGRTVIVTAGFGQLSDSLASLGPPIMPVAILTQALWEPMVPDDPRVSVLDLALYAHAAVPSLCRHAGVNDRVKTLLGMPGPYDAASLFFERLVQAWRGLTPQGAASVPEVMVISEGERVPFQAYDSQREAQKLAIRLAEREARVNDLESGLVELAVKTICSKLTSRCRWPKSLFILGAIVVTGLTAVFEAWAASMALDALRGLEWLGVFLFLPGLGLFRLCFDKVLPWIANATHSSYWAWVRDCVREDARQISRIHNIGLGDRIMKACAKEWPPLAPITSSEGVDGRPRKVSP